MPSMEAPRSLPAGRDAEWRSQVNANVGTWSSRTDTIWMIFKEPLIISRAQRDLYRAALWQPVASQPLLIMSAFSSTRWAPLTLCKALNLSAPSGFLRFASAPTGWSCGEFAECAGIISPTFKKSVYGTVRFLKQGEDRTPLLDTTTITLEGLLKIKPAAYLEVLCNRGTRTWA